MKFWKELIWIVTSVVLVICIVFLGIKLIQIDNNQEAAAQDLEELRVELLEAIVENNAGLDTSLDEKVTELAQYLSENMVADIAAKIAIISQQLMADLDENIDGVIKYLDDITDADNTDILLYLDEVKAELQAEIDAYYVALSQELDTEISSLDQYLQAEIELLYNDFVDNYDLNKEYTDSQILALEYLINLICQINGLDLPPAYTPPDFSEFE
jgi:hypothetical protein